LTEKWERTSEVGDAIRPDHAHGVGDATAEMRPGRHFRMRPFRKRVCDPTYHVVPDLVAALRSTDNA